MGNRRFAQVSTSDEEDDDHNDVVPPQKQQQSSSSTEEQNQKRKRKQMKLQEEEEEEEQEVDEEEAEGEDEDGDDNRKKKKKKKKKRKKKKKNTTPTKNNRKKKKEEEEEEEASPPRSEEEEEEEEEEPASEDAKPIGEPIKTTGKGRSKRNHYEAFEYDGNQYDLEDPVLIVPESRFQKPYVAIIKDITQDKDGSVMVTGQWFYRPEEAEKKGGGNWQSNDTRELFYSFHRDEVPAESVMHRCVVHFVPLHKQLPNRKEHPGFFVRKVYDAVEKKLWKLTDKDYEDKKQHEIDLLVQKTMQRLVDLPDIEPEDNNADQEEHLKAKRSHRRKNISPLDVSREEEATRPDQQPKPETPGSCLSNASEYHCILANFKLLTGETHRDKWLERLLQGVQYVCNSAENINNDDKEKAGGDGNNQESDSKHSRAANGSQDRNLKSGNSFFWPDAAVPAVTALEKASHESLSSDFQKYNQKLRQLVFNLKNNALLARRLINGELDPPKILNMTPNELKEGLTAEEMAKKEPDESERMQMTDARCTRCSELKVGLREIIQAGHGERYQLECTACGHSWYASRDDAATLTIDSPSSAKNVGTAPWATSKFEDVEKKLASPRESDRAVNDVFKKTSEAYMPVLETQKSFIKPKKEETPETPKSAPKNTE